MFFRHCGEQPQAVSSPPSELSPVTFERRKERCVGLLHRRTPTQDYDVQIHENLCVLPETFAYQSLQPVPIDRAASTFPGYREPEPATSSSVPPRQHREERISRLDGSFEDTVV